MKILMPRMRNLLALLWNEGRELEQQIVQMNDEVEQIASSDAACTRLRQIPGIGPLVATAIVAAIGNGAAFRKGRVRSVDGVGAEAVFDRWQGEAGRHQ